jgi:hydrogenase maturation protease
VGGQAIDLLVIGYGNELRGDDGAGRVVADRIDELGLAGVMVRSVTQLVPELTVDLTAADRVVFVDADVAVASLVIRRIEGGNGIAGPDDSPPSGATTHHATPPTLIGLAAAVGSPVPSLIEQISIPAIGFEFGAPMSAVTAAAVEEAVGLIVERADRR